MSEVKVNSIKGVGASVAAISIDNADGTCIANVTNNLSNRRVNKNGSFIISQKNADTEITLGSSGDRWIDMIQTFLHNTATFKAQRVSDAPAGFQYSAKHTVSSADGSIAGTDEAMFIHRIEGFDAAKFAYGTSGAKQVTVSFYVKSSLTGDFSFAVQAGGRNYVNEYTINNANTWERKSFTLPVLTTGTHNTTTGSGWTAIWDLGSGDDYATSTLGSWVTASNLYRSTGSARLSTNVNATWQITGIQVEEGTVMTDFEHFPVENERALCQRYCQVFEGPNNSQGGDGQTAFCENCTLYQANNLFLSVPTKVSMRAKPSMSVTTGTNYYVVYSNGSGTDLTGSGLGMNGNTGTEFFVIQQYGTNVGSSGHSAIFRLNNTSAKITFSAEL